VRARSHAYVHTSGANTRLKAIHADHLRVWKCQMSMCHMDALLTVGKLGKAL